MRCTQKLYRCLPSFPRNHPFPGGVPAVYICIVHPLSRLCWVWENDLLHGNAEVVEDHVLPQALQRLFALQCSEFGGFGFRFRVEGLGLRIWDL